jgi:flagellar hook-associated protein 3 FlgL
MSGSLSNIYNNVNFALNLHMKAMAVLQEQASTGSRINRASDDPTAAYRILGLNTNNNSLENYINNISEVVSILELSSTVVRDITSGFTETQIRLTQITSGIHDDAARQRTAEGINDILEQTVSLANIKHMDQYLFGGTDTGSAPYTVERTNGKITKVTYDGSFENRDIEVAPGIESSAFYIGDNIFRSNERSTPVFYGNTGAQSGTGTSSGRGGIWLTVTGSAGNYDLSIDGGLTTVELI